MAQLDRARLHFTVTIYIILALTWIGVARWIVPPLLLAPHPGRTVAAIQRYIEGVQAPFLTRGVMGRWWEFSAAVVIAMVLHLTILLILRRFDRRDRASLASSQVGAAGGVNLALAILSLAFLVVTVLSGPIQDYYLYLQMWYEVRQGHDPWFHVVGVFGKAPLNAYGPLFNLLAGLAWVNPLAPKLLFAYAYVLFSVWLTKSRFAGRPVSGKTMIVLTALLWNPFPWVEIAIRGHFDILVGLSCLAAIRAIIRGDDVRSAIWLALGVLLKFFPVVLVPFLAFDRGRLRPRFLIVAVGSIALGLGLSCYWWGLSTLSPLMFAATRRSNSLSIFRFISGRYSPLRWFNVPMNYDHLAPVVLFLALLRAWSWFRVRQPETEAAGAVAVTTTALFYQTGFPQYQMVPFVVGADWAVRHRDLLKGRIGRIIGVGCYFGWLAAFDLYYAFVDEQGNAYYWFYVQDAVGLPAFLAGCAFLAAVIATTPPVRGPRSAPEEPTIRHGGDGLTTHPPT